MIMRRSIRCEDMILLLLDGNRNLSTSLFGSLWAIDGFIMWRVEMSLIFFRVRHYIIESGLWAITKLMLITFHHLPNPFLFF